MASHEVEKLDLRAEGGRAVEFRTRIGCGDSGHATPSSDNFDYERGRGRGFWESLRQDSHGLAAQHFFPTQYKLPARLAPPVLLDLCGWRCVLLVTVRFALELISLGPGEAVGRLCNVPVGRVQSLLG